jgi:heme/copper-type cytochrome/quinol oxidase subunit 2
MGAHGRLGIAAAANEEHLAAEMFSEAHACGEAGVTYLVVFGGTVAAGVVPVLAYVAYKFRKSRQKEKEARRRRRKKIEP